MVKKFFCNPTIMEMIPWQVQNFMVINLIIYRCKEKLVYQNLYLMYQYIKADLLQKLLNKEFPIFALYTPFGVLYPKWDVISNRVIGPNLLKNMYQNFLKKDVSL